MAARKVLFPELQGGPPHVPPPPAEPYRGPMGLTTGMMVAPECPRCARITAGLEPLPEASEHAEGCPERRG